MIHLHRRRKVIEDMGKWPNAVIEMTSTFYSRSCVCWFSPDTMLGPTALFINVFSKESKPS